MSEQVKSIITCDLDGKVETFSDGAASLFGYTQEEVIGKMRVSDFSDGQVVLGHVVGWLAEAVKNGATVIIVSHKLMDVIENCDRATILKSGKFAGTFDMPCDPNLLTKAMRLEI